VNIVDGWPPNILAIAEALPEAREKGVIFTYGPTIYAPGGVKLDPPLLAHEQVHCDQQAHWGVDTWWASYIANPKFRLQEELAAHRAEYKVFCRSAADRNERSRYLAHIAYRLSGPLYAGLITQQRAQKLIKASP
jgi:hypothetical protein